MVFFSRNGRIHIYSKNINTNKTYKKTIQVNLIEATIEEYNTTRTKINFTISGVAFEACEGEKWAEWVECNFPDGAVDEAYSDVWSGVVGIYYSGQWTSVAMNTNLYWYLKIFCYRLAARTYRKPSYSDESAADTSYYGKSTSL